MSMSMSVWRRGDPWLGDGGVHPLSPYRHPGGG